jgi:hypothetical protein
VVNEIKLQKTLFHSYCIGFGFQFEPPYFVAIRFANEFYDSLVGDLSWTGAVVLPNSSLQSVLIARRTDVDDVRRSPSTLNGRRFTDHVYAEAQRRAGQNISFGRTVEFDPAVKPISMEFSSRHRFKCIGIARIFCAVKIPPMAAQGSKPRHANSNFERPAKPGKAPNRDQRTWVPTPLIWQLTLKIAVSLLR